MSNVTEPKKKMAPRDAFGRALEQMGEEKDFVVDEVILNLLCIIYNKNM